MQYRRLGKTGAIVSVLGFGLMRLPVIGGENARIDEEAAAELINYAIDEGVNYFDTAYVYHSADPTKQKGESEPFFGRTLQGRRSKVHIATKFPIWLMKDPSEMDRMLDDQLERLQTDHIDFYLIHNINLTNWNRLQQSGYDKFLDRALADGRIKYAGFSLHDSYDLFKTVVDHYDWSFCQIQYNYMDEGYQAGRKGLEYASGKDLGIVVMEPLRGGKLATGLPPEAAAVFEKAGGTPASWALRWLLNDERISLFLSGMNSMAQLKENIQTASTARPNTMDTADMAVVAEARKIMEEKIQVPCTTCGYCMPCPFGVDIPGCFRVYNNHFAFGDDRKVYDFSVNGKASLCTECGVCMEHCPQAIPIPNELKKVTALFEA